MRLIDTLQEKIKNKNMYNSEMLLSNNNVKIYYSYIYGEYYGVHGNHFNKLRIIYFSGNHQGKIRYITICKGK